MTKKEIETQLSERNAIYTATVYAFAYLPNVLAIVTVKKRTRRRPSSQSIETQKNNNGSDRLGVTEDDFPFHLLYSSL